MHSPLFLSIGSVARATSAVLLVLCAASATLAGQAPPPGRGVALEAIYTGDGFNVGAGGVRRESAYLDNLDLKLHLEIARMVDWPGAFGFVYLVAHQGTNPSSLVGDAQGVSNIAAPRAARLYEAWLQQNLLDGRLSLLAGLYDLNTEFDVIQSAGLFLNGSFGIGAEYGTSGANGPSIFPVTSLGLRVKYRPRPSFYMEAFVADGVPGDTARPAATRIALGQGEGALIAFEIAHLSGAAGRPAPLTQRAEARNRSRRIGRGQSAVRYDGKLAIGGWYYSGRFEDLEAVAGGGVPPTVAGSYGAYVLGERTLHREATGDQGLTVFARLGTARARVNRFAGFVGAGAVYAGLLPGRDDDEAGVAIAMAVNGAPYRDRVAATAERPQRSESTIEASYRIQARPWLALQPDVQYVVNPGTVPARANAWVFAIRGETAFKWWP